MRWTEEQINKILGFKGDDGNPINVFDLHGVLYIGTPQEEPAWDRREMRVKYKRMWNLDKTYTRYSEGRISISLEDFEDCRDEEEVRATFSETFEERVKDKLV